MFLRRIFEYARVNRSLTSGNIPLHPFCLEVSDEYLTIAVSIVKIVISFLNANSDGGIICQEKTEE